jgi:hypothetical protein
VQNFIRYGNKKLWEEVYALIEILSLPERMPAEWHNAIMCPTQKKGDK